MFALACGSFCQHLHCLALDNLTVKFALVHCVHLKRIAVNGVLLFPAKQLVKSESPHCHIVLIIAFGILNNAQQEIQI